MTEREFPTIVEIPHIDGVTINIPGTIYKEKFEELGKDDIKTRQFFQRENTSPEYLC